ncbi:MAG: flagellin [Desulfuromonadaceae bacterium]|nr:flagellin [Desulfuromonadaceae bacterium]
MATDISLTAGMRNNLLALQETSKLLGQTQNRLSTGKKVNTPLDNPTNFFAAENANARAADLTNRKDGMGEALQMVSAATAGIAGITSLIQAAQGVASSAAASSSVTDRANYATTYNTLMSQVSQLASDSGYRGTNFLIAQNQTVEFGQTTNAATLSITGFTATSAGLSIDTAGVLSGNGPSAAAITASSTFGGSAMTVQWNASGATAGAISSNATTAIQSASSQLETALGTLRSQSSSLAANLSVVTTRQTFTDNMINTLKTGADNLTLADMNQEGANMLILNTRQSLGTTSLSLASQAAQSVLRLF